MEPEQKAALAEALISLAWRDAVVRPEEIACLRLFLLRLGVPASDVQSLLECGTEAPPEEALRPLESILTDPDSRRTAMRMLVALCFSDHDTAPQELEVLGQLARRFGYGAEELEAARRYAGALLDPGLRNTFAGPCGRCRELGYLYDGLCVYCWERVAPKHPEWGDVCGRCGLRRAAFSSPQEKALRRCEDCLRYCLTCDGCGALEAGRCARCRPATPASQPPSRRPEMCAGCRQKPARLHGFCRPCAASPATLERLEAADFPRFQAAFFEEIQRGHVHLYEYEWKQLEPRLAEHGLVWEGRRCQRCGSPLGEPGSSNHYGRGNCWECWDG